MTFRIDSLLLDSARRAADAENRTLTNFVETTLKQRLNFIAEPDRETAHDLSRAGQERKR